jgi:hypothetical protein
MGAMLFEIVTKKSHQPIMYASRLLIKVKHNYSTTHRKVLIMFGILHKFTHYLLGSKLVFYVVHMTLIYLINKSQV